MNKAIEEKKLTVMIKNFMRIQPLWETYVNRQKQ